MPNPTQFEETAPPPTPEPFPPPPFLSACDWAKDGLRRALEGMGRASTGVSEYHIGTRGLHYNDPGKQIGTVGWWNEVVKTFCGEEILPPSVSGRDTAFRVVLRDV